MMQDKRQASKKHAAPEELVTSRKPLSRYISYRGIPEAKHHDADTERDTERVYLAWWNSHLAQHKDGPVQMEHLFDDVRTGVMPIKLLEVLSGSSCGKVRGLASARAGCDPCHD